MRPLRELLLLGVFLFVFNVQGKHLGGIKIDQLTDKQLNGLVDEPDKDLEGELDINTGQQMLTSSEGQKFGRRKRALPVVAPFLWVAGRFLFSNILRKKVSQSGTRLTVQYLKRGSNFTNLRQFARLKPTKVRRIQTPKGPVYTGQLGRYTITSRSWSSLKIGNGKTAPTLEIIGGRVLRKFRFIP